MSSDYDISNHISKEYYTFINKSRLACDLVNCNIYPAFVPMGTLISLFVIKIKL